MRVALTDKALSALKPKTARYEVHDTYCPGLSVRVTPEGRKTFNIKYRYGLKQKRMSLGIYPRMSLVDARARAMEAMRHVDEGADPAKRRRQPEFRVEAVVKEFIERYAKPRNRKWMESERILRRELVAVFGQRDIREIRREHIIEIMDGAQEAELLGKAPEVRERISRSIERGPIGQRLKRSMGYKCQICEATGNGPGSFLKASGDRYVEAHHATPVSEKEIGSLAASNIMILCANHHRQMHYGNVVLERTASTFELIVDGISISIARFSLLSL